MLGRRPPAVTPPQWSFRLVTDATINTYQGLRPYLFSVAYSFTGSASDGAKNERSAFTGRRP